MLALTKVLVEIIEPLLYLVEVGGVSFQLIYLSSEVFALLFFDKEIFILQQIFPLLRNLDDLVEEIVYFREHLVFRRIDLSQFLLDFQLFVPDFLV